MSHVDPRLVDILHVECPDVMAMRVLFTLIVQQGD